MQLTDVLWSLYKAKPRFGEKKFALSPEEDTVLLPVPNQAHPTHRQDSWTENPPSREPPRSDKVDHYSFHHRPEAPSYNRLRGDLAVRIHLNLSLAFLQRTGEHLIRQADYQEKEIQFYTGSESMWFPINWNATLAQMSVRVRNDETQVINADLLSIHLQLGPVAMDIIRNWQTFHPHQLSLFPVLWGPIESERPWNQVYHWSNKPTISLAHPHPEGCCS